MSILAQCLHELVVLLPVVVLLFPVLLEAVSHPNSEAGPRTEFLKQCRTQDPASLKDVVLWEYCYVEKF